MPLYVLAFTDTDLGSWKSGSCTFRTLKLGTIYAVHERRNAVPELTDDVLRAQHRRVEEIAHRSRATLPARFGALIEERPLVEWTRSHEAALREALDDVRDRVQMTIRVLGQASQPPRTAPSATTGRAYLELRRRALAPELPAAARELLTALRRLVARERIEAGQGGLQATVYHLISRRHVAAYRRAAQGAPAGTVISGPWPPFAFTPPLW